MNLLLTFFFSVLVTIALSHNLALKFFLYWKYPWLDIPMHMLGGMSVAFGIAILPFFGIHLKARYRTFVAYLCGVFFVGLIWEVFEIVSGAAVYDEYYIADTIKDFCMDLIGGAVGYAIVKSLKSLE